MKVPFKQSKKDGNACSLFTLANIFDEDKFIEENTIWISKNGLCLSNENRILDKIRPFYFIEDCCKDIRGIRNEDIKYFLEDEVEEGKFNLYILSTMCLQEFVDKTFHRCFVFTDGKVWHYVNSNNYIITKYADLDFFLNYLGGTEIIAISNLYIDYKPKSFTREELQHLLD